MVLRSADMTVDVALDIEDFKVRVAAYDYDAVVCCYTATEDECNEVIGVSLRSRLALLQMERFLSPQVLIDRVARLIREGRPKVDGAKSDSSL